MLTPRQTTLLCARAIRAAGRPFAFRFRGLRPQNTPVFAARHRRVTKWCVALDATAQNVKTPNSPRPIPSRADPEKGEPVFGKDQAQTPSARGSMAVELPGSGEDDAARIVIEQAGTSLGPRRRGIPATFIARLYGRAVPEDVVCYGAEDLSALAERAYDFIAGRAPGAPKIRCETVPLAASADRKAVTVVEIVNDDMPFLVDSVMGEIADRRLDVRLVAHPMFGVRRKGS